MIVTSKNTKNIQILKTVSEQVQSVKEANEIVESIKPLLIGDNRLGLAAIQIGINKKIGVIKRKEGFLILINSEVLEKEDEFVYYREGCLSFPNEFYNTKRYKHFTIKNFRIENDKFEEEKLYFYYPTEMDDNGFCSDDKLVSIAVQHEMDHFEGKIITEYAVKSVPIQRENAKIGRNDPCICGSLKKYKKCCGAK